MRSSKWWSLLLDGLFVWASLRQEKMVHLKLKKEPPSHQNFSLNTDPLVTLAGPAFLCLPPKTKSLILLETLKGKNFRTICLDLLQVTFYFSIMGSSPLGDYSYVFPTMDGISELKGLERPPQKVGDAVEFSGKTNRICVNFLCDIPEASANPQKLLRIFKTNPAPAKSSWLCKDPSAARMA